MGPGIYRILQYSISLFTSYLDYGKNDVQNNHMCDCPYCLHIGVVGTAEAIGGDNDVRHLKQQSTNDGGKQMWMTVWGGTGGSEAVKSPEAEMSVVKRPEAQRGP